MINENTAAEVKSSEKKLVEEAEPNNGNSFPPVDAQYGYFITPLNTPMTFSEDLGLERKKSE